ncbi:hypothetical protein [Salinarimonas rosea]|uniref:hypothetical protein n=1 Tax=Salinarimonas rosea TaxID=552063 RepID=UPI000418D5B1|nr:hypothetical protein [Salinarimonas rosea]
MEFTITFGWWLAPTIWTIFCFCLALAKTPRDQPSGSFDFGGLLDAILFYGAALIASLVGWLIYALAT